MSSEIKQEYFKLYIGGYSINEEWLQLIEEIVYEEVDTGSDLLTITFYDPHLDVLNSPYLFVEDQAVTFIGGYWTDCRTMFDGYVSIIDVDFPEDGPPTVVLHCMDYTHLMNREKKKRTWKNKKKSEVATEILMSYGFVAIVDDTVKVEETITQSDQTDIDFLTDMTKDLVDDFIVYVRGSEAYFVKKQILDTPQETLTYRDLDRSIINFSPRINKEQKQIKVAKSNVNAKTGAVDTGEATESIAREISGDSVQTSNNTADANGGGQASSSSSSSDDGGQTHTYLGNGEWS
jgi:hypothetical protein